jgi:hypothetical protein
MSASVPKAGELMNRWTTSPANTPKPTVMDAPKTKKGLVILAENLEFDFGIGPV